MEAAIVVDVGMSFVQATYKLEGDGSLVLTCYEVISALTTSISHVQHYPNAQAVARCISSNTSVQQQLLQYAFACVQPGLHYFIDQKCSSMAEPIACFFSPSKVHEIRPSASDFDTLDSFHFLCGSLSSLKSELPFTPLLRIRTH